MAIEFMDDFPQIVRKGGPRDPSPEIVEFLDELKSNPGKVAEFPGNRKTKPVLSEDYAVAGRNGKWYASYQGQDQLQGQAPGTGFEGSEQL